jgi:hypothetical protein
MTIQQMKPPNSAKGMRRKQPSSPVGCLFPAIVSRSQRISTHGKATRSKVFHSVRISQYIVRFASKAV